jgi:tetratricopeptide (TPR) repeat protein
LDSQLERQRERFLADPEDGQAFTVLEEELFLASEWEAAIEIYQSRLGAAAVSEAPRERAQLHFRMGQVYQDRLGRQEEAIGCYRESLSNDPSCRSAMLRLRRLHSACGQWEIALQIAEAEAALPQKAAERARLLAEMGSIWLDHLEDPSEALSYFSRALDEHPEDLDALEGSARAFESDGRPELAAGAWDRAIELLRGPPRASALISRARLAQGPLDQPADAAELYRRALTDAPDDREALDAVVEHARSEQKWPLLLDLQERRFELVDDPRERTRIAIESGRLQLERLENPAAAQMWFERAAELDPDDPETSEALADLARDRGDDDALLSNLERTVSAWDGSPPPSMLLELATLHSDRGDTKRAREELEQAFEAAPDDSLVAEALSEILARIGDAEPLIEVLERRAAIAGADHELRAAALAELAAVHEEQLDDPVAACEAYARAFDADPRSPGVSGSLERLYRKAEDWDGLRTFLESAAAQAGPDDSAAHLCGLAALLADRFDAGSEAVAVLERVLDADPHCPAAHRGLQHIAQEMGDEDAKLTALTREAAIASDPSRVSELVAQIAPRFEAGGDHASALEWIEHWCASSPESVEALTECARLREHLDHDSELIDVLERLDDHLEDESRDANRRRIGDTHARFDRHDAAIEAYRAVLAAEPEDLGGLRALETALEQTGRLVELADAKRQIADLVSPEERADCLTGLSALLADRLGDVDGAIDVLTPLRDDAAAEVDERLETYLERAGRYEELAEHLGRRAAAEGSPAPELLLRRAQVLLEHLDEYAAAGDAFRSVLDSDPSHEAAREGLERAVRAASDPSGLETYLAEMMESASDEGARAVYALERAVLLVDTLDREAESRELFQELTRADDESIRAEAIARLEVQLERAGEWEQLRSLLEASLGDEGEGDCRIHEQLGALYRDRLRNWPRAIDQYEAATMIAPERADLWQILASLYEEEGDIDGLVTAIEAEIATAPEAERELGLRGRAAELCIHPLNDADRAQEHYERVLELSPTHSAAADFLLEYWEGKGNPAAVASLLEARLAALEAREDESDWPTLRASLRLRIAGVRATELDDVDGAIAALESAVGEIGPQAFVAQPLADLYERAGYADDLIDLCRRAASTTGEPAERAEWFERQAGALERGGRDRDAAAAYRSVLTDRPDDRAIQAALCDVYRRLADDAPLARMLELELSHLSGTDEIPVRLELAQLLDRIGTRIGDALLHLRRTLTLQPDHPEALAHALELGQRLAQNSADESERNQHRDVLRDLIDAALAQPNPPSVRAVHLAHRARLHQRAFDDADAAIDDFRESLAMNRDEAVIGELRALLSEVERWDQVLDCVFQQTTSARGDERIALLEEAVGIAWDRLGPQFALPWLTRLRRERPTDVAVLRRIADAHRQSDKPEAALRMLDAELELVDSERQLQIHRDRAALLRRDLSSPSRAAAALEDARAIAPHEIAVLRELDELYTQLDRPRERANTITAWIAVATDAQDQIPLQRQLAELQLGPLSDPREAARTLESAVEGAPADSPLYGELLRELGRALQTAGDDYGWSACAERELRYLDPDQDVFQERRLELHRELAHCYEKQLGQPDTALGHLRALADAVTRGDGEALSRDESLALLRLLRVQGDWIQIESRLAEHLQRFPDEPDAWLELARLRDERLHWTLAAMDAYRETLSREARCLPALRGLRSCCERVGDWSGVAQALEDELEHAAPESAPERAALLRRLGDVYWHRLASTTRASGSYASALEAHPEDLAALRSLQRLLEAMEDWRGVADLYASEIEMLGDAEAERRGELATGIARLCDQHIHDADRAVRNYEYAAALGALAASDVRALAELYESRGDQDEFVATFEQWCDAEGSRATCLDHLKLAEALDVQGRGEAAVERIERAVALDPEYRRAWDIAARLREEQGDTEGAAKALSISAELCDDGPACSRLIRSAELSQASAPEVAIARLRQAVHRDPAAVEAHARLACLARELGEFGEAELSAGRALDLADSMHLAPEIHLLTAMSGGRAAIELDRIDSAVRCYSAAAEIAPTDPAALAGCGEALAARGEIEKAREILERRLALDGPNDRRAAQLALIGQGYWASGDIDTAAARFEAAIEEDGEFFAAHDALIRMWEAEQQLEKGIACLERWADAASDPDDRAERLLRAAEWELGIEGEEAGAERHLRETLDTQPARLRAWEELTSLLWKQQRNEEALQVASLALSGVDGAQSSPTLALINGRALETMGEREEAAEAFGLAAEADPDNVEATLSRARLLRALGDWTGAAQALRTFADAHEDGTGLSEVLQQLGQLLAGPLEDADGAIEVYRRSIELDPARVDMRAALAEFLSYRPSDWPEAVAHHQYVLNREPTHNASLRVLMRVSRERGNEAALATGLGIVRAIGFASAADLDRDPPGETPRYAGEVRLADPLGERLRGFAHDCASEIAIGLGASEPSSEATPEDALAAFHDAAIEAEGKLSAPALLPLNDRELGDLMRTACALVLDPDHVSGDGHFVNAMTSALKWRTRRKLRRTLEGIEMQEIEAVDFADWRRNLRALACAVAVEETGIELRDAVASIAARAHEQASPDAPEAADLSATIEMSDEARALLRRAVGTWLALL